MTKVFLSVTFYPQNMESAEFQTKVQEMAAKLRKVPILADSQIFVIDRDDLERRYCAKHSKLCDSTQLTDKMERELTKTKSFTSHELYYGSFWQRKFVALRQYPNNTDIHTFVIDID